jgi:hypothetical protein
MTIDRRTTLSALRGNAWLSCCPWRVAQAGGTLEQAKQRGSLAWA